MKKNLWLDYWDKKNIWTNSYLWKKNSKIFYKNTTKIFKYNKKMNILDIGCGNGDIAEKISKKVNQVFCVDISKEYVKICKKRFKKNKNIHVKLIKGNYTNLSFLKKKNFSIVLCNSVVQYYNSQKEIIDLVKSVKKIVNKNCYFLISDIEVLGYKKNYVKLFLNGLFHGYFLSLIFMTINLFLYKDYKKTEKKQKLLIVDYKKLIKKLKNIVSEIKLIDENLTANIGRKNILLRF